MQNKNSIHLGKYGQVNIQDPRWRYRFMPLPSNQQYIGKQILYKELVVISDYKVRSSLFRFTVKCDVVS